MWRKRPVEAAEVPDAERRRSVRQASLLEVAKATIDGRGELCRLRDVSTGGLCAEIYAPAEKGDRVLIELRTGHRIEGHVAWARGGDMGMAFDHPMPINEMLSHCSFDERVTTVRAPRVDVDVTATLVVQNFSQAAQVVNISQSGLKMLLDDHFEVDKPCTVILDHLGPLVGEIKWWRGREGGVMFDEQIPYPKFADWRRALNPDWQGDENEGSGPEPLPQAIWLPPTEDQARPPEAQLPQKPARLFGNRGGRR